MEDDGENGGEGDYLKNFLCVEKTLLKTYGHCIFHCPLGFGYKKKPMAQRKNLVHPFQQPRLMLLTTISFLPVC